MPQKLLADWPDLIGIKIWLSMEGKFIGLSGIPSQGGYYAYNFHTQTEMFDSDEDEVNKFAKKEP